MTLRKRAEPRYPAAGRTPADRDLIALALLQRARQPNGGLVAVWYGGGHSIAIKRTAADLYPEGITWREADRLAFPEKYVEKIERKPAGRAGGRGISSGVQKL